MRRYYQQPIWRMGSVLALAYVCGTAVPFSFVVDAASTSEAGPAAESQNLAFQGGGTIGVGPHFQPGQYIFDAVGIQYKFRVNRNASPALKIAFTTRRLYNPNSPTYTYLLDANVYTNWVQYSDTSCQGWPPRGQYFNGQSGLWVSIPDYPGEFQRPGLVGIRPSNLQAFPRQNSGIDGIPGLTKIESISQMDIDGKDIAVRYYRGNLLDPATDGLSGWGYRFQRDPNNPSVVTCEPNLPSGFAYRKWHAEAIIDATTYRWDFALPADSALYLAPFEVMSIVTEFLASPGLFQTYFWDFAIQRESSASWEPLNTWRIFYQPDAPTPIVGWGAKISTYNGRPVLEISNDGTDSYFRLNDVFEIALPPPVAPPTGLTVSSVVGNLVTLRWNRPSTGPAPTGYVVEGGVHPGEVLASIPTESSFPIYTLVVPAGRYYVRIHSVAGVDRSAMPSNEVLVTVDVPVAPSPPANLLATVDASTVALSWTNTFLGGAPTSVILDVTGSFSGSIPLGSVERISFDGVPAGSYALSLRATNAAGPSVGSNSVVVTVPGACSGPPQVPSNFLAYKVGRSLSVIWEPAATGPAPESFTLRITGALVASFTTPGRFLTGQAGTGTYDLSVIASNSCGSSAATAPQTVSIS